MSAARRRIAAVVRKEWAELRRNRMVASAFVAMPLLVTTIATITLVAATNAPDTKPHAPGHEMEGIPPALAARASTPRDAVLLLIVQTALMLQLLVPATVPSITAIHSIIGEKQARTLEPLLATPLRTWELLVAKLVATVVPGVVAGWVGSAIYVAVAVTHAPPVVGEAVLSAEWAVTLGVLGPLVATLGVSVALVVSSRVVDVQAANAAQMVVVLPVVGFAASQVLGLVTTTSALVAIAATLAVIDAGMIALCVSVFERETILTRWR